MLLSFFLFGGKRRGFEVEVERERETSAAAHLAETRWWATRRMKKKKESSESPFYRGLPFRIQLVCMLESKDARLLLAWHASVSPRNKGVEAPLPWMGKQSPLAVDGEKTNASSTRFFRSFVPLSLLLSLTHEITPLFLSAPKVTLVSTSCRAATESHDIWLAEEGEKKKRRNGQGRRRRDARGRKMRDAQIKREKNFFLSFNLDTTSIRVNNDGPVRGPARDGHGSRRGGCSCRAGDGRQGAGQRERGGKRAMQLRCRRLLFRSQPLDNAHPLPSPPPGNKKKKKPQHDRSRDEDDGDDDARPSKRQELDKRKEEEPDKRKKKKGEKKQ